MPSRHRRFLAACVALMAMVFAQMAFALAACDPVQGTSEARVVSLQQADAAPCHEPADNTNLCLAHCQSSEQTLDKHQVKVSGASAEPVLLVRAVRASPMAGIAARVSPVAGPPARILFSNLRI